MRKSRFRCLGRFNKPPLPVMTRLERAARDLSRLPRKFPAQTYIERSFNTPCPSRHIPVFPF
jgi:hypothetical protein